MLLAPSSLCIAQVTENQLARAGMEQMWQAQVQLPAGYGSIVSTHLWASKTAQKRYAEITFPVTGGFGTGIERRIRVSADKLDSTGKPIGFDAAKKEAEVLASRVLGRSPGIAAIEVTSPVITLLIVTSDGLVQAFDAETGQKLWSNSSGPASHPAAPAFVNDYGVALVHGLNITIFDIASGKQMQMIPLRHASANGVALCADRAFVPSYSGQLLAYSLTEPSYRDPWGTMLIGHPVSRPVAVNADKHLVAVGTDKGMVTVFSCDDGIATWYGYRGKNAIVGPMNFSGDGLYAGDELGQIVKLGADDEGHVRWRVLLGQTIATPVISVDNVAYIATEIGNLYAVEDTEGHFLWPNPAPRVKEVIAVTDTRIFCRSLTDRVMVLDKASGKLMGETAPSIAATTVQNSLNDRVYIISASGRLQALREAGSAHAMPKFHKALPPVTAPPAENEDPAAPPAAAPAMNPDDPFGGAPAASPAPAAANPFGAADPFGAPPAAPANGSPF